MSRSNTYQSWMQTGTHLESETGFCFPPEFSLLNCSYRPFPPTPPSTSIIVNSNGILVGARCSKSIPDRIGSELLATSKLMEQHLPFLVRGKQVANLCANFVVTGLKEDQNMKLKMSHAPKNERSAFLELEMRSKLRGFS
jgi:hypothetical protein